ncbi:MAG TPA: tRNA (adenosine(37)-N6)-threonylcarbamoyltransferase complex ATPase subunit type 1 TsaE [Steroidobacteraceae bacterium]
MHLSSLTAAATEEAGASVARARPAGADVFGVIYLRGDLGAGKTTWARGFLAASGVNGVVRSPTYTLVELYDLGTVTAVHLDLYRLQDESELETLGVRDWAQPGYLWLIEWPERAPARLPAADLCVQLNAQDMAHDIIVSACSALGESWLERACA